MISSDQMESLGTHTVLTNMKLSGKSLISTCFSTNKRVKHSETNDKISDKIVSDKS